VNKRDLLKTAALAWLPGTLSGAMLGSTGCASTGAAGASDGAPPAADGAAGVADATTRARVRPGQPGWPDGAAWSQLGQQVGGRLRPLASPFTAQGEIAAGRRMEVLGQLWNPFFVGDQPELTQTSGWLDAWTSRPSAWVVAAQGPADVAAAVAFARTHRLRLVVKGGGHSYQGTSDAPDSLLIWTRAMNAVALHEAFVPAGCEGLVAAQPAVSLGAGCMWADAYDAVTTRGGRYVQGGGCNTVGVAGLVQSGGFGSFSKAFGTAAAGLLEAEVVTADGSVRLANARRNPELFWALKGGGGGSFGVVTRLTLRTRELPETFGGLFGSIKAKTDDAQRALIARVLAFCREALLDPHWGEQIRLRRGGVELSMVFQGIGREQALATWQPLVDWVRSRDDCAFDKPLDAIALPARHFWDAAFFRAHAPQFQRADDRPGAPESHVAWAGDLEQVGWFIHAYRSAWLPAALLQDAVRPALADALFAATRHWSVGLHLNKGLAGAPPVEIAAARDTATNPQVLDAFALAIIAGGGPPAFPGMPGTPPDPTEARDDARDINSAMDALLKAAPGAGAYVSESDYFQADWEAAFWGINAPRLAAAKKTYDPDGLFFVRHGVGSGEWSGDGFTRVA
jgi:FAD/FMN-containing dehydrogenase